jgi:hypothetical protein
MADFVAVPAMASDSWLARAFGWAVGAGPGGGVGLLFVLAGLAYVAICLFVLFCVPDVRNLEDTLPDAEPGGVLTETRS